jgi:hypothetical protein
MWEARGNAGSHMDYMALHPRRWQYSLEEVFGEAFSVGLCQDIISESSQLLKTV